MLTFHTAFSNPLLNNEKSSSLLKLHRVGGFEGSKAAGKYVLFKAGDTHPTPRFPGAES